MSTSKWKRALAIFTVVILTLCSTSCSPSKADDAKITKAEQLWKESSTDDEIISIAKITTGGKGYFNDHGGDDSFSYTTDYGYIIIWKRENEEYISPVLKESIVNFYCNTSLSNSKVVFKMEFSKIDDTVDITNPVAMLNCCVVEVLITINDPSLLPTNPGENMVINNP